MNIAQIKLILILTLILSIGVNLVSRNSAFAFAHLLSNLAFAVALLGSIAKGLRNFSLLASSLVISLIIVELYFVLDVSDVISSTTRLNGDGGLMRPDDLLGYTANPGEYIAKRCVVSCEERVVYDAKYSVNPQGHRRTPQADSSHLTAIFFGGSFTFGSGVNDDETLPYYFAQKNPSYGVLNLGLGGYGPQHMLRQLESADFSRHTGQNIELMVFHTSPELADRSYCIPTFSAGTPKYRFRNGEVSLSGKCWGRVGIVPRILDRSTAYKTIRSRILPGIIGFDEKIDLYLQIINKASKMAKEKYGCRFVVAYLRAQDGYFHWSEYSNDKILRFFSDNDIEYIDVTLASDVGALSDELKIIGDGHPSPLAHKRRAEAITEYLR